MALQSKLFDWYLAGERRVASLKRKRLNMQEGDMVYLEGGQGPTVVLLHGFGADKDTWNKFARHLTKRFHVVAIDIPGFGESYSPSEGFDIASQARRIEAFLLSQRLRNITLIGNSYGGYITALLSQWLSPRLDHCVLISPLGVKNAGISSVFKEVLEGMPPLLLPQDMQAFSQLLKRCFHSQPFLPKFARQQLLNRNLAVSHVHENVFFQTHLIKHGMLDFDYPLEEILMETKIPTHVLWGEYDQILMPDGLTVLDRLANPNITTQVLMNVGHLPQLECPKTLSTFIIRFIQETSFA